MTDTESALEDLRRRAELLLKQSKKDQLFRHKQAEAKKQAAAGSLFIELAEAVSDPEDQRDHLTTAAACFARAKRLCRDVIRQKPEPACPIE